MYASDPCLGFLTRAAGLLGLSLLLALPAGAQQATSRDQEQLRRLRLQVQQLRQAQTQAQDAATRAEADKAAAITERDAAREQLASARNALERARGAEAESRQAGLRQREEAERERATLQAQLQQARTELQARTADTTRLREELAQAQGRITQQDQTHTDLQARHLRQAEGLQACITSNHALRNLGEELLQRYAKKTVAEVMADNEPFLRWHRVGLENLVQDYEDKLDSHAVRAATATGGEQPRVR